MLKIPIDIWIGKAEENWLHTLYSHAKELFHSTFLPSHDHSHHLRVWNISKKLLKEIATTNSSLSPALVEGVMIAAFFHDLGMAESTREDHGRLGKELCRSWFSESGHLPPPEFDRILEAIEMHDRKEARYNPDTETGTSPGILGILSAADDLEAMGVIGIYRYAEIYLLRGIPLEDLGRRILENAELRFLNLNSSGIATRVIGEYRKQYEELCRFYNLYNRQVKELDRPDENLEGQLGVINYIRSQSMTHKVRPEDLYRMSEEEGADLKVSGFFRKLKIELEKERV
ncbi:MAG: HD domain-containing protein [Bacteroidia bacterium]|nr:MAG: HD domain-containing protein [Bacteroidia bacterium]